MCAFEINFFSVKQEFHRFSTEHFALLELGFGNYNLSSVDKFLNTNGTLNPDIAEFFQGSAASDIKNKLIGVGATIKTVAYDDTTKKYKLLSGLNQIKKINTTKYREHNEPSANDLTAFLSGWNDVQLGIQTNQRIINGYKLIANRIQNSLSGCISFYPTLNVLGIGSITPEIRLYLLSSKDSNSSRTLGFNGSPIISAQPTTSEGLVYGNYTTNFNGQVGVYDKPTGNDPKDNVAAQMRLVYDPVSNKYESGTQQVLARLIDSIDATEVPKITGSGLMGLTKEMYSTNPEDNPVMGPPKTGRAMVMSSEEGNPNLFGPNFKGSCDGNSNKSIITAVNRSSKSYSEGTIVVCSYIRGEWIIVSGEGAVVDTKSKLTFGRHEYQQYLIPTNLYFCSPVIAENRLFPNVWISKIRDDYYNKKITDDNELLLLNAIASRVNNGVSGIITEFLNGAGNYINDLRANADLEFAGALDEFDKYYCDPQYVTNYIMPDLEHQKGVPKNVLINSNRKHALNLPSVNNTFGDLIDKNEVPLFWGILFPDGYKSNQCATFINNEAYNLGNNPIFSEDQNLKELSAGSTASLPSFDDPQKVLRYLHSNTLSLNSDPLNLIRENGGYYQPVSLLKSFINNIPSLESMINFKRPVPIKSDKISDGIYGLEPINPRKIQFTPLSIDSAYMLSTLDNSEFQTLNSNIQSLGNGSLPPSVGGGTIKDYAIHLFSNTVQQPGTADQAFAGNVYNLSPLSYSKSFSAPNNEDDPQTILNILKQRHPAPRGVVNGNTIVPYFGGGDPRSSFAAVTTMKQTVKTNANGLKFDITQYFGNPPKQTVSPGRGFDNLALIPMGGTVIVLQPPTTDTTLNSSPQWGDREREDDIDSFGTMALHVRIFEAWPENQTIYLGPIFTPLHFNPGIDDDGFDYVWDSGNNSITKTQRTDDFGNPVPEYSSVDFTEPSFSGVKINPGNSVTENNIDPVENWQINTVRRAKLLSNGGFAYFKNVICVSNVTLRPNFGGQGYKQDEEFFFSDGCSFKVNVSAPSGIITSVHSPVYNFNSQNNIIANPGKYTDDILSLDIQPDYFGSTGGGAQFTVSFKVAKLICLDSGPAESSGPRTRLTSKSNSGAGVIESVESTTITLNKSDASSATQGYDIFYFLHNDPTMYSSGPVTYNNYNAQYIISEVNPA